MNHKISLFVYLATVFCFFSSSCDSDIEITTFYPQPDRKAFPTPSSFFTIPQSREIFFKVNLTYHCGDIYFITSPSIPFNNDYLKVYVCENTSFKAGVGISTSLTPFTVERKKTLNLRLRQKSESLSIFLQDNLNTVLVSGLSGTTWKNLLNITLNKGDDVSIQNYRYYFLSGDATWEIESGDVLVETGFDYLS